MIFVASFDTFLLYQMLKYRIFTNQTTKYHIQYKNFFDDPLLLYLKVSLDIANNNFTFLKNTSADATNPLLFSAEDV